MPSWGTPFHSLHATSQALQPMQMDVSVKKPLRGGGASQPARPAGPAGPVEVNAWSRSEEHTSELQSRQYLVCRLLLEKTITAVTSPPCKPVPRISRPCFTICITYCFHTYLLLSHHYYVCLFLPDKSTHYTLYMCALPL